MTAHPLGAETPLPIDPHIHPLQLLQVVLQAVVILVGDDITLNELAHMRCPVHVGACCVFAHLLLEVILLRCLEGCSTPHTVSLHVRQIAQDPTPFRQ